MPDHYIDLKDVECKEVKYLKIHSNGPEAEHPYYFKVMVPEPLASWDVYDYWERLRTLSMAEHLHKGDILFDIGSEYGWQSAVYAQMVGADSMVLIEPTPEYWPNIKATWQANKFPKPLATYCGLLADVDKNNSSLGHAYALGDWPTAAGKKELINNLKYNYIHEHRDPNDVMPQTTIDSFVQLTGIVPDALTMDTEGAELPILRGAEQTLATHHPKVWVSVHPDLSEKHYGVTKDALMQFMEALGYTADYLDTDHEEHYFFHT